MLEFINNNGVLFSGLFGIISALITAIVAIVIDNRKSKYDIIRIVKEENKELRNENKKLVENLQNAQKEIETFVEKENSESNIDKSRASIYTEELPNGNSREICGYCWERERIKIPINVSLEYQEYPKMYYHYGYCNNCESRCIEYIDPEPDVSSAEFEEIISNDEDLPF